MRRNSRDADVKMLSIFIGEDDVENKAASDRERYITSHVYVVLFSSRDSAFCFAGISKTIRDPLRLGPTPLQGCPWGVKRTQAEAWAKFPWGPSGRRPSRGAWASMRPSLSRPGAKKVLF
jgi:hypothetical protein